MLPLIYLEWSVCLVNGQKGTSLTNDLWRIFIFQSAFIKQKINYLLKY